jgi:hypothetical protein
MTRQKKKRNIVYYICGGLICFGILCIALLNLTGLFQFLGIEKFRFWTFLFEALSLYAFGLSWLTKGEGLFPDGKTTHMAATGG